MIYTIVGVNQLISYFCNRNCPGNYKLEIINHKSDGYICQTI